MLNGSGINITIEGKRHLGAAIGSQDFRVKYANAKVEEWCKELKSLSEFAKSEPQAAHAAFCFGEQNKFNYFMRTIPGMSEHMKPVDEIIKNDFLPSILGETVSEKERELFSLPVRCGGLGIPSFTEKANHDFENSLEITAPLVALIITQGEELPKITDILKHTTAVNHRNSELLNEKVTKIENELDKNVKRAVMQAKEKGAYSWLSVITLEEHGFALTKSEFRDALCIRYDKPLRGMRSKCPCGHKFDITHALNCKRGGFVIMRHNNVRDFEVNLLKTLHNDVEAEPELQPIQTERLDGLTGDNAHPDIRARGVWRAAQNAYFDVRLTNVNAESQKHLAVDKILKKHEKEKSI